jgi:thiaminase
MCDRIAAEASEEVQREMMEAYMVAAEYEWEFWDWAYQSVK